MSNTCNITNFEIVSNNKDTSTFNYNITFIDYYIIAK